jgi:hypothetical protein
MVGRPVLTGTLAGHLWSSAAPCEPSWLKIFPVARSV